MLKLIDSQKMDKRFLSDSQTLVYNAYKGQIHISVFIFTHCTNYSRGFQKHQYTIHKGIQYSYRGSNDLLI